MDSKEAPQRRGRGQRLGTAQEEEQAQRLFRGGDQRQETRQEEQDQQAGVRVPYEEGQGK